MLSQASSIHLITQILDANVNKDLGTLSRYLYLWCTIHPSLGNRYMVAGGDVDALSLALVRFCPDPKPEVVLSLIFVIQHSIYRDHGQLIPSVECCDTDGRVWIGFRGVGPLCPLRDHMGVDGY